MLIAAAVVTLFFGRWRAPVVLGYLAAGIIIGPNTPPYPLISDLQSIRTLADLGVIFLLFSLGAEFNLRRFYRLGIRSWISPCLNVLGAILLGYQAGWFLGWSPPERLFLGAILGISSTAIVAKTVLEDQSLDRRWRDFVVGVLVTEDILAVLLIGLCSTFAQAGSFEIVPLLRALLRFGIVMTAMSMVGFVALPRFLRYVSQMGLAEIKLLAVIGVCFGFAILTQKLGFSFSLGAFLAGALLSEAPGLGKLEDVIAPFKNVFLAVFFVSVGMLIDVGWILRHLDLVIAFGFLAFLFRLSIYAFSSVAVGHGLEFSLSAALALAPVGEFSYILAQVGHDAGLTSKPFYTLAAAASFWAVFFNSLAWPRWNARKDFYLAKIPNVIVETVAFYQMAIQRLSVGPRAKQTWHLCRPSVFQIIFNIAWISAIFLGVRWLQGVNGHSLLIKAAVWLAATAASLPFLIALWRKFQAVVFVVVEAVFVASDPLVEAPLQAHRPLVRTLLLAGTVLMAWWFLALIIPVLPPWPVGGILMAAVLLGALVSWRFMIRFYARLQRLVRETVHFSEIEQESMPIVVSHLALSRRPKEVEVSLARLGVNAEAVGRSIQEINLRRQTGASILQITSPDGEAHSPHPDTVLCAGDELMLIGEKDELEKAAQYLSRTKGDPS